MKKIILITTALIFMLWSCVEEDYFGKSQYGYINTIEVSNQSGAATIIRDSLLVNVEIPGGVDLTAINIEKLEVSSFCKQ